MSCVCVCRRGIGSFRLIPYGTVRSYDHWYDGTTARKERLTDCGCDHKYAVDVIETYAVDVTVRGFKAAPPSWPSDCSC